MFEVGKKVICIKDHSQGVVKKGQIFELHAIKKGVCGCGLIVFDIGKQNYCDHYVCGSCNKDQLPNKDGIYWLGSILFAPYDDSLSTLTDHDIIHSEEVTVLTSKTTR